MTAAVLLIMGLVTAAVGGSRYWQTTHPARPSVEALAAAIEAPEWDPVAEVATPLAIPTPEATQGSSRASTRPRVPGWPRLRIAAIDVDAPISSKSIGPDGTMQNPNGPEDVAWYDFSARPGSGGNVVMSGHVDYHNYGPAVFARLSQLGVGDMVEIVLQNGTRYIYRVVSSRSYRTDGAPTGELLAPTSVETLTLITCSGEWNNRAREYTERLIVRAQLVQTMRGN